MKKLSTTIMRRIVEDVEKDIDISSLPDVDISADRQILKIIMNAERQAVKAGKQQSSMVALESIRMLNMNFLLEKDEKRGDSIPIDVGVFGIEIMRIVKNFDTMLDIPSIVIKRAQSYLLSKYGKEVSDNFIEYLKNQFDFAPQEEQENNIPSHVAIGAMGVSAGG